MKTALITGGLGLIGSFVTRKLIKDDIVDRVILLDHYGRYVDSTRREFVDYRKLRMQDIEDKVVIERGEAKYFSVVFHILNHYRPEYIFHLAALPLAKLQNLNTQEAQEGSVVSTSNILEAVGMLYQESGYKLERFVYASSSMVYGDFKYTPVDENHVTNPKEIYGTMKLAGESVTKGLSNFYDIPSSIVRPSAVYGPTDMNRRVSQIFLEKAMLGERVSVHGADEALDFTYVKDIARGFVLASTKEEAVGEVFNITHGKAHTLLEFVTVLKSHFPELEYEVVERDASRPRRGTLSIDKARELLGYEPQYSLEKGIEEYVNFVKEHNANFRTQP
ncbi:MAG: 3-beta hydroxysteroid dehydrogenase [Gemmatimonadetes bacterium]|nr:3-beta hydroxysteroid dehydrogenase [Gemmatimonadota bacterium]